MRRRRTIRSRLNVGRVLVLNMPPTKRLFCPPDMRLILPMARSSSMPNCSRCLRTSSLVSGRRSIPDCIDFTQSQADISRHVM